MPRKLPKRVILSPDVIFEPVHAEAVLFDLGSEESLILNEQGVRMWQLLSENGETGVVIQRLLAEYDVDEELLHQDMADWVAELVELGFISLNSG